MFVWTARFSRAGAVALALVALAALGLAAWLSGSRDEAKPDPLVSNDQRIAYLNELGWDVVPEPLETLQQFLPSPLPERLAAYNELQRLQGFDLSACCGRQVTRYTYTVTNYPGRPEGVQLNLYLCEGLPSAGDVIFVGSDGFQQGLAYPS